MKFIADLHVHSRFSRATAKNLDLENLYIAAQLKGIAVVGTGDFTHPGWLAEIKTKLVPTHDGLLKLRPDIAGQCDLKIPPSCRNQVRFVLTTEISNIYKKNDRTRKNHNLLILKDIEYVERLNSKLDAIGNISSDGRPILGLDARDLLERVLEIDEKALFIPAHIWTPWFSLFGSKSGFELVEECFEDLSPFIFAVETGLSSDPAMNWRVKNLDHLTLVSNSDAHSPLNLGREANLFETDLTYSGLIEAIKTGDPRQFLGTYEFYPEEGKYHWDGHRRCKIRCRPEESRAWKGVCPACGKPLTLGVLYRVEELADRPEKERPQKSRPYFSTIPLADILGEILQVGVKTKTVQKHYFSILEKMGPEFEVLHTLDIQAIEKYGLPLLGEAVFRMRNKEVVILPGYDGEFGQIKIFNPEERARLSGQKGLFSDTRPKRERQPPRLQNGLKGRAPVKNKPNRTPPKKKDAIRLNPEQLRAVEYGEGPLLIVAGPGTGKTHTLASRIARLICEKKVPARAVLAITFTNKAAQEMRERLVLMTAEEKALPLVTTFHALGYRILSDCVKGPSRAVVADEDRKILLKEALRLAKTKGHTLTAPLESIHKQIISAKQQLRGPDDNLKSVAADLDEKAFAAVYRSYQDILDLQRLYDYEDLLFVLIQLLQADEPLRHTYQRKFRYIFVDEYQDINYAQHRLINMLAQPQENICVIGDPRQSIYGFRGSTARYFEKFVLDYPRAATISLSLNYRSAPTIVDASLQVVSKEAFAGSGLNIQFNPEEKAFYTLRSDASARGAKTISILETASEAAEAVAVGKTIEKLIGGTGFHYMDFGGSDANARQPNQSFSDFAVLYRTAAQSRVLAETFKKAGIPFQLVSRENYFLQKGVAEIISLYRIVENIASLADFERARGIKYLGLSKNTLDAFKNRLMDKRQSLDKVLANAGQFDVPGLKRTGHRRLEAFVNKIKTLRAATRDMTADRKLTYLSDTADVTGTTKAQPQAAAAFDYLLELARKSGPGGPDFITGLALETDTDLYMPESEKVSLMTMHASKGLEFPVVFIVGCEDGLVPLSRGGPDGVDLAEERRLFYVAMTRAKERLYLSHARKRTIYGRLSKRRPSPFIDDVDEKLRKLEADDFKKGTERHRRQLELF